MKIIAIAAVSAGGKTTIVNEIKKQIANTKSLHFDDYSFDGEVDDFYDWVRHGAKEMQFGFYFPDCPLRLLGKVLPGGFDKVIDTKIENNFYEGNCLVFNERLLYRAIFIILHEYGHYVSYKCFDEDKVAYVKHVYDSKTEFREYEKELNNKLKITEEECMKRLQIYRDGKEEKFADDYALERLEETVQLTLSILEKKL